jgi:nucleotide-binding universal stress UspA family protein
MKLLVPTDGTDSSEKAADHAIDLARKLDAEVHTIFVASAPRAGFTPSEPDLEPLKESGETYVARVRESVEAHEIPCTTEVFESDRPYEGILTYAEENDIDYIVMGTHGEDAPFPRFFLGSVTERVLKASPIPVLVIPAHEEDNGEES